MNTERHISNILKLTDEEVDELVGTMVDIETLFVILQRDASAAEDAETKQIYHYLFRLLRKSVAACCSPVPDFQTLGKPPYEEPTIGRALMSLIAFHYGHISAEEWTTIVELAKILCHTINVGKLDAPSVAMQRLGSGMYESYKIMYTR